MEVTDLIGLIGNVGFPVAISAYLLIRLEKQMRNLSSSINKLNTIISTKLGIVIDTGDSDHAAWRKALNIFCLVLFLFLIEWTSIIASHNCRCWFIIITGIIVINDLYSSIKKKEIYTIPSKNVI